MTTFINHNKINFKFNKSKFSTAKKIKNLDTIPFQLAMYSDQDYNKHDVNFNNLGIYNYWKNYEMINNYKKIIDITEYNINLNSKDRNIKRDKNPLDFTINLNNGDDFTFFPQIYKNVKYINFDHIIFPYYYQLLKYKENYAQNDIMLNDIQSIFLLNFDNMDKIGIEIETINNSYQICNIISRYNYIEVNYTINRNKEICYNYINDNNNITISYYKGYSIKNPGNYINYISINKMENEFIYSTNNVPFFKDIYPKMKINSELYIATRKSYIIYKNSNLITINKFIIKLFDSQLKQILINNLDYDILNINNICNICNCSFENINYSCKCYYLRHPLNNHFQIDIFIKIGCYTPDFNKEVFF
jgi:hypothetical protein